MYQLRQIQERPFYHQSIQSCKDYPRWPLGWWPLIKKAFTGEAKDLVDSVCTVCPAGHRVRTGIFTCILLCQALEQNWIKFKQNLKIFNCFWYTLLHHDKWIHIHYSLASYICTRYQVRSKLWVTCVNSHVPQWYILHPRVHSVYANLKVDMQSLLLCLLLYLYITSYEFAFELSWVCCFGKSWSWLRTPSYEDLLYCSPVEGK